MNGVDLRPLALGEILDRTFSLYRRHFLLFIGIAAIPHLLTLALQLVQILSLQHPVVIERGGAPRTVMIASYGLGVTMAVGLFTIILSVLVYLFSQGGTILAVTELYLGRQTSVLASLRRVWDDIGSLFGVVVLNGLATFGALLLLVIPGIYVACRLLVCLPSALVEGRGPSESLSRSWELTRGYAGRAFIICLLYFVLAIGVSGLIGAGLAFAIFTARNDPAMLRMLLVLQQVFNALVNIVISPFLLIGTSVFYFDLRVRKEAFDLQFMMDPTSERVTRGGGSVPSILS